MKLRITEAEKGSSEYYVNEYLPSLDNKKLVNEFAHVLLQNVGQRGKYDAMISEVENEILSRMK